MVKNPPIVKSAKPKDEELKDPWKKLREKTGVRVIDTARYDP